jgi:hypothetical protein
MAMNFHFIDYNRISKALTSSAEALRDELGLGQAPLADLQDAKENLRQALSFGLSVYK